MEAFNIAPVWAWLIIGGFFLIAELLTGSLYLLWPGVAAMLYAAVAYFWPDVPIAVQILAFAALSIGLYAIGRGYFKLAPHHQPSDRPNLNERGQQLVGQHATAMSDFVNGVGSVQLGDTRWSARGEEATKAIAAGSTVEVISVDGAQLVVARVGSHARFV